MLVLPIQADAPADTIKHTTPAGVGSKYCFRCYAETGKRVRSSNSRNGVCANHGGTVYRAPEGMTTCIKCNRIFKPLARENSCNACVSPVAVAKRIKSAEKRRMEQHGISE